MRRAWRDARGFSTMELAASVSLVGSLLAVAVPTFLREVRASRFVEPVQGLGAIAEGALAYATSHGTPVVLAFPRTVGLTPYSPPRGHLAADAPGTWNDLSWTALHFPPTGTGLSFADGVPHAFSFAFDSNPGSARSTFKAHAHGDLDGDGTTSTFEVHGFATPEGPVLEPGMYVESELE